MNSKTIILLVAFLGITMCAQIADMSLKFPVLSESHVQYINSVQKTWKAGHNKYFFGKTLDWIRRLLGSFRNAPESVKLPLKTHEVPTNLPDSFDSRDAWPKCESLFEVRDQANCGSCWAISAVETMSDRICIHSGQTLQTRLSTENLLACCSSCGDGCDGGYPAAAWQYYKRKGIVTGDLQNVTEWCQPYSLPPCDHHVQGSLPPCQGDSPTPQCKNTCRAGYSVSYKDDLHFASDTYSISSDEDQIKTEIMKNGPVQAAFTVYSDFLVYKEGVYSQTSSEQLGGHAIKIIGWGVENGTPYWTVVNSWNTDWGFQGTFKIKRGSNECGIEDEIVAGLPKL